MLKPISQQDAARLREFFVASGYMEVRERLGLAELSSLRLRNFARLMDVTREPNRLNVLLRWFWIGVPQEAPEAEKQLPEWFIPLALGCGLLRPDGNQLAPEAMLVPIHDFLILSDQTSRMETGESDVVLWPNPTSRLLSNFTIRRPSRATLDLGSGNGIQALAASAHSDRVVATDLNARAAAFAEFNFRLNDVTNVEYRLGDGYEPVAVEKFDLIVSNPPFFISPADKYLFCDNPMELDQLCRKLARGASEHLNENGYFQMLCEWAQVRGQSWQERVTEWFKDSGCDVWLMKGHTQDPSAYAQDRIREITGNEEADAEMYESYMAYYRQHQVEAIHDGLIAMRRRAGHNWISIEEAPYTPSVPFGDSIERIFASRDFLQSHTSDAQMLTAKPKMSPDVRLEHTFEHGADGWKTQALTLKLSKGLPFSIAVQPLVAEFLAGCDGAHTLAELTANLAQQVNAPIDQVQKECLGVVRMLIERRCLIGQT